MLVVIPMSIVTELPLICLIAPVKLCPLAVLLLKFRNVDACVIYRQIR